MARRLVLALTFLLAACDAGSGVLPAREHGLQVECVPGSYQAIFVVGGAPTPPAAKPQNGAPASICNAQPARVLTSPQPAAAALSARTVTSHATGESNGAPVSIGINGGRAPNALASPTPAATPT